MKEIEFINNRMSGKKVETPQFLYKYRPFDEFAFDMLEKGYVYLCPAEKLDDPSECQAEISINDFYDVQGNGLKFKSIDLILEMARPYTTVENYNRIKEVISRCITQTGLVKRNILLDISFEIQKIIPEMDVAPLVNYLGNIPEELNDSRLKAKIENLIILAYNARKSMGICSLSSIKNQNEMWKYYAGDSSGYCIEYCTSNYKYVDLLYPVVYSDLRETNIVKNIIATFVAEMIYGISHGQAAVDKSYFARMFLTKNTIWDYQREWRLLGDADTKLPAFRINKIYLGKKMSQQNIDKFKDFCIARNIALE